MLQVTTGPELECERWTKPVFLNVYGAPESIPIPKEWIPPAYVAWRAGTITLFLLGS